jgi:hypothetical protein
MGPAWLPYGRGAAFTCALLVACAAVPAFAAAEADAMLRAAIETRMTVATSAGDEKLSAVFLDTAGNCAFAALVHAHGEIENFSVCDKVVARRNVSPPPWPDTAASREFRERVVYLALLYGTSSGIDPNGFKIRARLTEVPADACKIAEVATIADNALVRLDLLPACPH